MVLFTISYSNYLSYVILYKYQFSSQCAFYLLSLFERMTNHVKGTTDLYALLSDRNVYMFYMFLFYMLNPTITESHRYHVVIWKLAGYENPLLLSHFDLSLPFCARLSSIRSVKLHFGISALRSGIRRFLPKCTYVENHIVLRLAYIESHIAACDRTSRIKEFLSRVREGREVKRESGVAENDIHLIEHFRTTVFAKYSSTERKL